MDRLIVLDKQIVKLRNKHYRYLLCIYHFRYIVLLDRYISVFIDKKIQYS